MIVTWNNLHIVHPSTKFIHFIFNEKNQFSFHRQLVAGDKVVPAVTKTFYLVVEVRFIGMKLLKAVEVEIENFLIKHCEVWSR